MINGLYLVFTYEKAGLMYVSPISVAEKKLSVKEPRTLTADEKLYLTRARIGQYPRGWKYKTNSGTTITKKDIIKKIDTGIRDECIEKVIEGQIAQCQKIWQYLQEGDSILLSCEQTVGVQSLSTIIHQKMRPVNPANTAQMIVLVKEYLEKNTGYYFSYPGMNPVGGDAALEYVKKAEENNRGIGAAIIDDVLKKIYQTDNMKKIRMVYDALFLILA
jgi:hypothetical protein